jgi:dihydroneopterin aldolase
MQIQIEDLRFQTIIGLLDFERVTPQDVIVYITIEYIFQDLFIDYAEVAETTKSHLQESKFLLIEDALGSLSKHLKEKFPLINTLSLKITKPSILPDCKVSVSEFFSFES